MRTIFTMKDLQGSACASLNPHLFNKSTQEQTRALNKKATRQKNPGKQKPWIAFQLTEWATKNKIALSEEYKFHPERKWRFDWCFEEIKVAVEYEGIFSAKSRHTTAAGFTGDTEKYNAAQQLGWTLLRYTALNYLDLITDLENLKKAI